MFHSYSDTTTGTTISKVITSQKMLYLASWAETKNLKCFNIRDNILYRNFIDETDGSSHMRPKNLPPLQKTLQLCGLCYMDCWSGHKLYYCFPTTCILQTHLL